VASFDKNATGTITLSQVRRWPWASDLQPLYATPESLEGHPQRLTTVVAVFHMPSLMEESTGVCSVVNDSVGLLSMNGILLNMNCAPAGGSPLGLAHASV
jgi:hypothetical protein